MAKVNCLKLNKVPETIASLKGDEMHIAIYRYICMLIYN